MSGLQLRIVIVLALVVTLTLGAFGWQLVGMAETIMRPTVDQKAETVGITVKGLVQQAVGHDIPLDQIPGVEPYLANFLATNPEIAGLRIEDAAGEPLYGAGIATDTLPATSLVELPVTDNGAVIGQVVIGTDPGFTVKTVLGLSVDLVIVTLVSVLIALELVSLCFGAGLYREIEGLDRRLRNINRKRLGRHAPVEAMGRFGELAAMIDTRLNSVHERYEQLRTRLAESHEDGQDDKIEALNKRFGLGRGMDAEQTSLIAVRAPLFLFMFAEELTRPFLPAMVAGYAEDAPAWLAGTPLEWLVSIPFIAFLALVALCQPIVGPWSESFGRMRTLVLGTALGVAGYLVAGVTSDLLIFTLARAVTGIGFAMVFIGAQGYILDRAEGGRRGRDLAGFIGAILVAGLCGPPIGGLLADRLGFQSAIMFSAGLAFIAGLLAVRAMGPGATPTTRVQTESAGVGGSDFIAVVRTLPLMALFTLAALPAKLVLTGFGFFMMPLTLATAGYDPAVIGRVMMIYPIAMVLLVPVFGRVADELKAHGGFVFMGALVVGCGLAIPFYLEAQGQIDLLTAVVVASAALGIGQALSIAPQSALVAIWAERFAGEIPRGTVFGVFRLIERGGAALAPALAAPALAALGFAGSAQLFGAVIAIGGVLFVPIILIAQRSRAPAMATGA